MCAIRRRWPSCRTRVDCGLGGRLFRCFPFDAGAEDIALDFDFPRSFKSPLPGAGFGGAEDEFLAIGDNSDGFALGGFFFHASEMTLELARIYSHVYHCV